jgi:hypothetical protein
MNVEAGPVPSARTLLAEALEKQNGGQPRRIAPFQEVGVPGLKYWAGKVDEEFLSELRNERAIEAYREMGDNSPVVGAMLFAIKMLARQVEKRIEPADDTPAALEAADLVETSLDDMSHSWEDLLNEILTMVQFGWSYHEVIYKVRQGANREPGRASRFTDGRIGWRKMPIRAQDTLYEWVFDERGGVQAMVQQAPPLYQLVPIPIGKSLLFRPESHKNNPEGRSALRTAYRPWYYLKRIEEIEGFGIARDLVGYPVISIPAQVIAEAGSKYGEWKDHATQILRDEQEGMVIPSDLWEGTNEPMYKVQLLSSGGERSFNTTEIINRYNRLIAMTVMADFLFLGQEQVGSFALASNKTSLFAVALGAWMQAIAAVFNRHAIPRLMGLNNIPLELVPSLVFGDLEQPDPEVWAKFLAALAQAGFNLAGDPEIENWLRQMFNMPEMSEEDMELMREADTVDQDEETRRIAREEYDAVQREQAQGAPPVEEDEEIEA